VNIQQIILFYFIGVMYILGLIYVIGFFPYVLGAEQSANSRWPPITSLIILLIIVPIMTKNGLQEHEEGRLFLIVPFFLASASLGLLIGWMFRKPSEDDQ